MVSSDESEAEWRWADMQETKKQIGRVGARLSHVILDTPIQTVRAAAQRVEELGYSTLWVPESPTHREPLTTAAVLLGATTKLSLATGIANIWARDAVASRNAAFTLAEVFPGRFTLGLGTSHKSSVNLRGHEYAKPLKAMADYIGGFEATRWEGPGLPRPVPLLVGALRPKMLELAREHGAGVHPLFMPLEHTAEARRIVGPDRVIAPNVAVVVDPDPDRARARARSYAALYLGHLNYANALRWLGFDEADIRAPGSDRLIDAIIPWGYASQVAARISDQFDAGADHVCIHPVATDLNGALGELEELAPLLV